MHARRRNVIVLLGPPGCGKGTQAACLSPVLRIPSISTGELLRCECRSGSTLGKAVRSVLDSGRLVTDDLINQIVARRLSESDCRRGCILDGYPRTGVQARFLDTLLDDLKIPRPIVFQFEIECEDIVARLGRRRQCPKCGQISSALDTGDSFCASDGTKLTQRADDNPETIRERLRLYEQNAGELIQYYADKGLCLIRAMGEPAEISRNILRLLRTHVPPRITRRRPKLSVQPSYRVQPA